MPSSNPRVSRTPQRSSSNGASEQGITPRWVFGAALAWWKVALPTGLLLAAAGVAAAWTQLQPKYEASAWLRIDERPSFVAFESPYQGRSASFMSTQVELLRSPLVLGAVVREPEIAQLGPIREQTDAVRWLATRLRIEPVGQSELLKISLTTSRAEDSARIVNAVVDAYFELRSQDESERAERVIKALEEERDRRAGELAALRGDLQRRIGEAGANGAAVSDPTSDPAAGQAIVDLQGRLINAEVEQEMLKARLKVAEQSSDAEPVRISETAIDRAVETSPRFQKLSAALVEKRERLCQIEARSAQGQQDPLYRQLREEIAVDEESLRRLRNDERRGLKDDAAAAAGKKAAEERSSLRSELEGQRVAVELLRRRYQSQLKELKQAGPGQSGVAAKHAELERAEKVFELIAERVARLRTEQRAPGRVTLLQRAEPPAAPVEASRLPILGLVWLAGLCLPFAAAVAWERLAGRVRDAGLLEGQTDRTLLAEVPCLPAGGLGPNARRSQRAERQLHAFEESIDGLRAALLCSEESGGAKVLAVLSAARGEGKTSVAAQLAMNLAQHTGKPTLLIDGDLRSPAVHGLFDVCPGPGLAEVLAGKAPLEDAIVPDATGQLDVLPAGACGENAHRRIGSEAWRAVLQDASARYEHIVLDTPPLLSAGESLAMAKAAGACVLCVMRGDSRMPQVLKARNRLQAAGVRLAGIVLNGGSARRADARCGRSASTRPMADVTAPNSKAQENTHRERTGRATCRT